MEPNDIIMTGKVSKDFKELTFVLDLEAWVVCNRKGEGFLGWELAWVKVWNKPAAPRVQHAGREATEEKAGKA